MASAPKQPQLPLFFNDLMPLNSKDHKNFRTRSVDSAPWLSKAHAIPLTVDEFVQSQRHFPIVFSSGENPLPLALMGLNEGVNTFVDDAGKVTEAVYIPAYIRRYPFMLAKLQQDATDLSLMFDPTSDAVGEFEEGERLFDDEGNTTDATKRVLEFCQHFEQAAQRTQAFLTELKDNNLLMDGEVAIQREGEEQPFIYRGFKMVDQEKLRELSDEKIIEWHKNGILMLVHAHIYSLELMRTIFARQAQQGKAPQPNAQASA
ncbi:SapC family protein [Qipengyuania gelatinilytica]|uniref:SapC family protein n=1 Tax=Qipengyuania gelatinilytica TaxID=2867231 RepID=A0ABX9A342_9SPHN|nr:SapC family protein [Qipengyuania gelatinilytica]QZD95544.1 SapC family protein [Qipengyuania gelatinilytica]